MVNISREGHKIRLIKRWKYLSFVLFAVLAADVLVNHRNFWIINRSQCPFSFGKYRGHEYKNKEQTVSSTCLVESKWMKVQRHVVKMSEQIIDDWLWIDYHDRINVLVQDEEKSGKEPRFLVFEQSKYALDGKTSLAVIGGIVEPREEAEVAARREVDEELGGMQCKEFHFLGKFRTDVNRGMAWVNSFLATNCRRRIQGNKSQTKLESEKPESEEVGAADTERQDLKSITLSELRQSAINGEFLEVQWSNTVLLALLRPELATYVAASMISDEEKNEAVANITL